MSDIGDNPADAVAEAFVDKLTDGVMSIDGRMEFLGPGISVGLDTPVYMRIRKCKPGAEPEGAVLVEWKALRWRWYWPFSHPKLITQHGYLLDWSGGVIVSYKWIREQAQASGKA